MNDSPVFSVVIPLNNKRPYIRRCAVRGALYRGDIARARRLNKLFPHSIEPRVLLIKLGMSLPDAILRAGLRGFSAIKARS